MTTVARFEKVSLEQYKKDMHAAFDNTMGFSDESIEMLYEKIELPRRATSGSVGYDFTLPFAFTLDAHNEQIFPTGIRCRMNPGWALFLLPADGYGFRTGMKLLNTIDVVDRDYYDSENEGHILVKLDLPDEHFAQNLTLEEGKGFVRGIFLPYGLAVEE
ncbi:MAG: deoxyuridine 5'-triphosphate nucleotidohydrolase [Firmicutes bacterium]|nr:deoxyuridine 5'-triphosphate nucleotidohydrolase [Bacillota bacterium]MBQ5959334.1 deoxyuridine 5'-triphosphate nucleotidohydrolase [Bacillota bacterium]